MFRFGRRSREKLKGVHPDLVLVVSRGLLYSPYDFAITEGQRSMVRQRVLRAKGFSQTLNSKHLLQPDGYAHAVDVVAIGDLDKDGDVDAQDKARTWNHEIYGEIATAMQKAAAELGIGIRCGAFFKSWYDGPHFELERT